ncbi:MAG: glycerophosphoryl diester phosphodiesterase [Myxococcota bacterium]|jgi:glycerophosphoryl diester phosphodiesterase
MTRRLAWTALLLAGCAHSPRSSEHLFPAELTVMGHRGAQGVAPENTMAAFEVAASLSCSFELDTTICGTGELVVIHDDTLDRTTSGSGPVAQTPLSTLRTLDAGSHFHADFEGEPVPLLDEVLAAFGERVVVNIEIKGGKGVDAIALGEAVAGAVEAAGLTERVIVTSFNPFVLEAVRAASPDIFRGQIYGTFRDADLNAVEKLLLKNLAFNRRAVPDLLMVESAMIKPSYIRRMHRRGYRVFTWTVNDPAELTRVQQAGVDGIITDDPAAALAHLAR